MRTHRRWILVVSALGAGWLIPVEGGVAAAHHEGAPRAKLAQACADARTPVKDASASALRTAVLCLINQQRTAHGLPGLHSSERLNRAAQQHTQTMVRSGYFGHGSDFTQRFSTAGYDWRAAGENIAAGYTTPASVVAAWMASPDHCRNILSPAFRDAGTGLSARAVGAGVWPGTWTEDFGLLMSQSPASGNTRAQRGCPY